MRPGNSSRPTWSQLSRVSWRKPLPSAPRTRASGARNGTSAKFGVAGRVEADQQVAALLQFRHRPREVLHGDDRHIFQRTGGGLGQRAGRLGAVPRGRDDSRDAEARCRAQDRAHVVGVGDLIEHQQRGAGGDVGDVRRGQGIGLEIEPLMDRIGRQPFGNGRRPDDVGRRRDAFLGEAAGGVLGGEELADLAGRVLQRRLHGVPAVEHGEVLRPQAFAAGALETLAPIALLMGDAGLLAAGAAPVSAGLWIDRAWRWDLRSVTYRRGLATARQANCSRAVELVGWASVARLTWAGCNLIKRARFVACGRFNEYLKLALQMQGIGRVSRVAKGADCKSAGLRLRRFESYLSHQPSRPRRFGWQVSLRREGCPP